MLEIDYVTWHDSNRYASWKMSFLLYQWVCSSLDFAENGLFGGTTKSLLIWEINSQIIKFHWLIFQFEAWVSFCFFFAQNHKSSDVPFLNYNWVAVLFLDVNVANEWFISFHKILLAKTEKSNFFIHANDRRIFNFLSGCCFQSCLSYTSF